MLIKTSTPQAPGLPLNFPDNKIDILLEKLSLFDERDVAFARPKNDFSSSTTSSNDPSEEYDDNRLNAKAPVPTRKTHIHRDQPYEQRTLNRFLMNGGEVFENDRHSLQNPQPALIAVPTQTFQSQLAFENGTATKGEYRSMGLEAPNIPLVPNSEWYTDPQYLQIPVQSQRLDSPLSSDSGINSPSGSPKRRIPTWDQSSAAGYDHGFLNFPGLPTVEPPSSPESAYSPSSPENSSSWPQNNHYAQRCTGNVTLPSQNILDQTDSSWMSQFGNFGSTLPNNCDWQYPYATGAHDVQHQQNFVKHDGAPHPDQPYTAPLPESPFSKDENDELLDALDELLRRNGMNFDSTVCAATSGATAAEASGASSTVAAPTTVPAPEAPEPTQLPEEPKTIPALESKKNNQSKTKPRPERTPQTKRKSNKVPLDGAKPKIYAMLDLKKEASVATWFGICLMPEEQFSQKNSNGQNCLMEVLLEKKLSLERAYLLVQRMRKNSDLLTSKDRFGENALYLSAMRHPNVPELASYIAETYAKTGIDANEGFFEARNSLLHCLVEKGESHREVLRELLDLKFEDRRVFDPNVTNENGDTPLHVAVRKLSEQICPFNLSLIDVLIKRGASISMQNRDGDTPLHVAAKVACNEKVIQKLLERLSLPPGENQDAMNCQDRDGNTPLHLVAYHVNPCQPNLGNMKKVMNVFLSQRNTRTDIINNLGQTAEGTLRSDCIKEFYDMFNKRK